MKQIVGVVVVALVAVLNLYVAIPLGYGFELSANAIGVAAFVGSVGGTVAMVFVGDRIMPVVRRLYRRIRPKEDEGGEGGDSGEQKS
ncbi:MAG: hypothetical protein KDB62_06775, partial [Solirubrobacterales bacterium]|nr:hypothetical protein [Solirubrobacterales bacterium]